ncbi:hypothetical protein [uncultured Megasphaera sp.]|uniref:hypothetical protein n=1 Tax=uncultured Megasphaera sp. TaxID=165188 RepID=UPI00266DA0F6|nr:hypothetical protein [uncultured Megasphaera sp.]
MIGTNVDYYAAGFDADGKRIVSKIVFFDPQKSKNADKVAALLEDVKATAEGVAVAEIISAEDYVEYLAGKVRGADGKPVEYIPPEPTDEEKAASAAASIAAKYNPQLSALKDNLVTAVLTGDEELQAEIKEEYAELMAEYNNELEALQNG